MDFILAELARHGYAILFASVFLEAMGLPVPAAIALLLAGAASAHGALSAVATLGGAFLVILSCDNLMFFFGRYSGWWLLGLLCRFSLNPESCILRSADAFYKRGRTLLVFAKFVPGINTMAPPLAGSMNMRWTQFFGLDAAGAALYVSAYWSVGFLFGDAVGPIMRTMQAFSRVFGWIAFLLAAAYLVYLVWNWFKVGTFGSIPRVRPTEAASKISIEAAVIYDVRSHGYYDGKARRIQGSKRLEPNALNQRWLEKPPDGRMVYLYCTCRGDATSIRVAKELIGRGFHVAVIAGGLRAWRRAGLPLEPVPAEEVDPLPAFETN
jgi:membrane protein DedA with SNARE-associated domain/rhodanese-related sulfurtransferase